MGYFAVSRKTTALQERLKSEEESHAKLLQSEKDFAEKQVASLRSENQKISSDKEALNREKSETAQVRARVESDLQHANEKLVQQKGEMERLYGELQTKFENMANQILKKNSADFKSLSEESIKTLVSPLNESIKDFKDKVEKCYGDEAKERFSLQQEITKLIQENQKISADANNLANALKGESQLS